MGSLGSTSWLGLSWSCCCYCGSHLLSQLGHSYNNNINNNNNNNKCASERGAAAAHAETEKANKYSSLDQAYYFQLVAIETSGSVGPSTMSFLRDLGHHLKMTTGEPQSFTFLLQRLSVAIQSGNAISVLGSLGSTSWLWLSCRCIVVVFAIVVVIIYYPHLDFPIYNLIIINVTHILMLRNYSFNFGQNVAKRGRNMERHREHNIAEPKFELKSFRPSFCVFYSHGRI